VTPKVTLDGLREMKREGRKIAGVVVWDAATAEAADRAGVDIVSAGDSAAVTLWGRAREGDLTIDEMLLVCTAVSRGAGRALVSCDLPAEGLPDAERLVTEGGADVVKVAGLEAASVLFAAGIPVFASICGTGDPVDEATRLEEAGASLIDFRHSGPENGRRVAEAVSVPVLGGLGGGPWLDGRMRAAHRLLDDAFAGYVADVRGGRPVKGD